MIEDNVLNKLQMKEMVLTQINSWELVLKRKGLKEATVDRKIKNILGFYIHIATLRKNKNKIRTENITDIAFEYVRDGYFSDDNIDNEGSYGYRRIIYSNIREGFNYIYEDNFKDNQEVIKDLSEEQKEILDGISKNKFFRTTNIKDDKQTIQTQLIEELGIKVYFDDKNLPYVYSHELAELIGKQHKDVMKKLRELYTKLGQRKKSQTSEHIDFTIVEDTYKDSQTKIMPTLKIYKDILINYILGMNGDKYFDFKIKYQSAFNYIEQEHNRLLKEYAELKDSFLKMYNDIRKRNRDLLIMEHNKKAKAK